MDINCGMHTIHAAHKHINNNYTRHKEVHTHIDCKHARSSHTHAHKKIHTLLKNSHPYRQKLNTIAPHVHMQSKTYRHRLAHF